MLYAEKTVKYSTDDTQCQGAFLSALTTRGNVASCENQDQSGNRVLSCPDSTTKLHGVYRWVTLQYGSTVTSNRVKKSSVNPAVLTCQWGGTGFMLTTSFICEAMPGKIAYWEQSTTVYDQMKCNNY